MRGYFDINKLIRIGVNDLNWLISYLQKKGVYIKKGNIIRLKDEAFLNKINESTNNSFRSKDEVELLYKKINNAWSSKQNRDKNKKLRPIKVDLSINKKTKSKLDKLGKALKTNNSDVIERAIEFTYEKQFPSRLANKSTIFINRDIIKVLNEQIEEKDKIIQALKNNSNEDAITCSCAFK